MDGMVEVALGDATTSILSRIGQIGLWLQALGVVVVLWIIFEIIALTYHRKRMKEIYKIKEDMGRIEGKIDRILEKKGK